MPAHRRVKLDEQRTACLQCLVVRLPVGRAVLLWSLFHPAQATDLRVLRWSGPIYAIKPSKSETFTVPVRHALAADDRREGAR